jgi:hypothetical protein
MTLQLTPKEIARFCEPTKKHEIGKEPKEPTNPTIQEVKDVFENKRKEAKEVVK